MNTVSYLKKHPEKVTKEDAQAFFQLLQVVKVIGKQTEGYNIKIDSNNTTDYISTNLYQEHSAMSAILEAFIDKNEINYKDLNESVFNRIPKEVSNIPIITYQTVILRMIRMGLITSCESEDEYLPIFKITDIGIDALTKQTFQSLAASSFYNYQTRELNKRYLRLNLYMLIVTIVSILVTLITIFTK